MKLEREDIEFDFLVGVYEVCDSLKADKEELNDKSEFIIRALAQQMANFYKMSYPNDIDIEIEVMINTLEELEIEEDYELCAVYRGAIKLLKNHQDGKGILLP